MAAGTGQGGDVPSTSGEASPPPEREWGDETLASLRHAAARAKRVGIAGGTTAGTSGRWTFVSSLPEELEQVRPRLGFVEPERLGHRARRRVDADER